ncbi:MAG TPA: hypothetical protein VNI20_06260, partial [Fimbriimonadaceae bacterium]|nr:hypothetical protein [Fimbriimonadaceae bacterium]
QLGQLVGQLAGAVGGGYGDLTDPFPEDSGKQTNKNYDPGKRDKLEGDTKDIRKTWKDLDAFFNSKQPPAECVPIKNAYEQCLGETGSMVLDVQKQLENSHDDPQGAINSLISMMGTSQGKIDVAANESDQLVYRICRKYDTFKWFKISSDIGGGLMGGMGGLLGGLGG